MATLNWDQAQMIHVKAKMQYPDHDRIHCWCCCESEPCEGLVVQGFEWMHLGESDTDHAALAAALDIANEQGSG